MSLSAQQIDAIREILTAEQGVGVREMRARFPTLKWTACDASDLDDTPLFTAGAYDVHLLDAREHCVGVTSDPEEANGFMLAARGNAP